MTKIYLVRHAHYVNLENIIPGRLPISISEKGIEQSKRLQAFFADKQINKIYSSPVKRCVETSEIMAGCTIPVILDERLAETLTPSEGLAKEKIWRRQLYTSVPNKESPDRLKTPLDFLTVYDNILKFNDPSAKAWLPDHIGVMPTRYSNSPEIPLKWNDAWGNMASATTVKRTKNLYSIYIDKKYFIEFVKLLESLKKGQSVEINGGKYSLTCRFPLPNFIYNFKNTSMEQLINQYKEVFGKYQIPETLKKLISFEEQYGKESYSESFYLHVDLDKKPDRGQYSLDEEYFERLMIFAHADGTGSNYAFWANEIDMPLEDAPIVFMGSEGHIQIIAKNIKELIKLLSFGPEPLEGSFYKELDDFEDPENAPQFREWMVKELNLQPIKNLEIDDSEEVNTIVQEAVKKYGEAFKEWMMSLTPQYDSFDQYE